MNTAKAGAFMDYNAVIKEIERVNGWIRNITPEPIATVIDRLLLNAAFPVYLSLTGLVIIVVLVFILRPRNRLNSKCKWKKSKMQTVKTLTQFKCKTCGYVAFTSDGRPPKDCKRGFKARPL